MIETPIVGFCNTSTSWGGGEKWHLDMAIRLREHGHATRFFSAPEGRLFDRLTHSPVWHAPMQIPSDGSACERTLRDCERQLRRCQLDAIIVNELHEVAIVAVAAKRARIPRVIFRCNHARPFPSEYAIRYGVEQCLDTILVHSRVLLERLIANGYDPGLLELSPFGMDATAYDLQAGVPLLVRQRDETLFGCVLPKTHCKELLRLLDMVYLLRTENLAFRLLLVGESASLPRLKRQVEMLQLESHVLFCGHVENMKDFYEGVDALVHVSPEHGLPTTILEAAEARVPVVAFNNAEVDESIVDGHTGLLANRNDEQTFLQHCRQLATDVELREQMGANAREHALATYPLDVSISSLLALLGPIQDMAKVQ